MKIQRIFSAAKKDSTLELLCYDAIGSNWDGSGITAANFSDQIKKAGAFSSITLRINSPGGDAFEGVAILNLLRSTGKPVNVFIDGLAASAASILAMAGDQIVMGDGAMLMIHNAWSMCMGDARELRKTADTLEKVSDAIASTYVSRTGKSLAQVKSLMDAETWMSAEEAVEQGFANSVSAPDPAHDRKAKALRASFDLSAYAKAPKVAAAECSCACSPCADDGDCSACSHVDCDCPGCTCNERTAEDAVTEAISNLSLYEARLRMLGK